MSQVELTTLGKSCEFFNGKAHEKSIDENGKYIVVNSKFISQEGKVVKRTKEQMFPLYKGDIVMVMSDVPNGKALAKCYIIDKDDTYSLNQRICCIRSKEFDTKYLYYQLNRHEHFLAFNNGENQTNLRKDDILACPLIKPSMEEQKRMVLELDEVFKGIDKAKQNIEINYTNTLLLVETETQSAFQRLNSLAVIKKLGDVFEIIGGGTPSKSNSDYYKGNIPWVTVRDMQSDYIIDTEFSINIVAVKESSTNVIPKGNVIIATRVGLGKVCILNKDSAINQDLKGIVPKSQYAISNRYLFWWFKSISQKIISAGAGMTVQGVRLDFIKSLEFPLVSIEEQISISKKLDSLYNESLKLQNKYAEKLFLTEELKGGVKKRAFENELIEVE